QAIAAARTTLAGLSARPLLTPEWQQSVTNAMTTLHGDNSPETARVIDALAASIANVAAGEADPQHLPQARLALDFGLKYMPDSPRLTAESAKLDALQAALQAKAAQESADAEVKSRIESMRSAAAADDVVKASQSLARIKALQPDNPFLQSEGPKLLADAYLGLAQDTFQKGRYQKAAEVLGQGLHALTGNAQLRAAKARYDLVAAIMAAGKQPIGTADYAQLKRQLEGIRRSDPTALAALESDMRIRGQLSAKSLDEQLDRIKPSVSAPPAPPPAASSAQAPVPETGALPGRPTPVPRPGAPVSAQPGHAANPAAQATGPSGPDPCAKPGLAGSGKFCIDKFGTSRGPFMVVVPGVGGGRPYAMSRAEIPISNISLDQARAYARWLSDLSGFAYRLPTDAEWLNAAAAGGRFKQADDSNCVPPSAGGGDGGGAPVSARGRSHNPWGLVNMTGNVWEWVVSGGSVAVRGGSFNSYWSDCSVNTHREDSGSPQRDVGFRLLREVK